MPSPFASLVRPQLLVLLLSAASWTPQGPHQSHAESLLVCFVIRPILQDYKPNKPLFINPQVQTSYYSIWKQTKTGVYNTLMRNDYLSLFFYALVSQGSKKASFSAPQSHSVRTLAGRTHWETTNGLHYSSFPYVHHFTGLLWSINLKIKNNN